MTSRIKRMMIDDVVSLSEGSIMPDKKTNNLTPHTGKKRPGPRFTKEQRVQKQEAFLEAFNISANVRASCEKADISRFTIYEWAEHDEIFSIRFKQAELDANDRIREEMHRRAVEGYTKPLVSVGKVVYDADGSPMTERVYSDMLLSLLAKARLPEFRDKSNTAGAGIPDDAELVVEFGGASIPGDEDDE